MIGQTVLVLAGVAIWTALLGLLVFSGDGEGTRRSVDESSAIDALGSTVVVAAQAPSWHDAFDAMDRLTLS